MTTERTRQRIAAFLCETFEAGRVSGGMGFSEADSISVDRDPEWYEEFAREHKEIFEDPNAETEHDWPLWETQADELLKLLTNGQESE